MTTAPYTMHKEAVCIDYIREIGRKQCLRRKPVTSEKNIAKSIVIQCYLVWVVVARTF